MGRSKININKAKLERLYIGQNLSPYKIAPFFKCSFKTVSTRLKEYGIPLRSPGLARNKFPKADFCDHRVVKAYMCGFRLGDLNVYCTNPESHTIVVRCHTTQKVQLQVISNLFYRYGKVSVSDNNGSYHINCFLNRSFAFLLPKDDSLWLWTEGDVKNTLAFIAGYVDAEGNFILNQGKARFKIDSYDHAALKWISKFLNKSGINVKLRLIAAMGSPNTQYNTKWKKDLWRLNINDMNSLIKFISLLAPYLRHSKRIKDTQLCMENVISRKNNANFR